MKTLLQAPGRVLCFSVLWAFFVALPLSAQTVTMTLTTEGKVSQQTHTFTVGTVGGLRVETLVTPEGTTKRSFDADGALRTVEWTGAAGRYTLTSDGSRVKGEGTYQGKPVQGTTEVRGKLWDRGGGELDFSLGFRALAQKGFRGSVSLFTIAPDKIASPVELAFAKDGDEVIAGRPLVRVKFGLTGVFAMMWSGLAWVDPTTGEQVRLKSNKGPGTPETLYVTEKGNTP